VKFLRRLFPSVPASGARFWRQRAVVERRREKLRTFGLFLSVAFGTFVGGMIATNPDQVNFVSTAVAVVPDGLAPCRFIIVNSGDSLRCGTERILLADAIAPEVAGSARCEGYRSTHEWCDFARGARSKEALRGFLERGAVGLERQGKDRFGRTMARVIVNGQSAGEYLMSQELARPRW
jgi:hypothetical protein